MAERTLQKMKRLARRIGLRSKRTLVCRDCEGTANGLFIRPLVRRLAIGAYGQNERNGGLSAPGLLAFSPYRNDLAGPHSLAFAGPAIAYDPII